MKMIKFGGTELKTQIFTKQIIIPNEDETMINTWYWFVTGYGHRNTLLSMVLAQLAEELEFKINQK